MKASGTLICNNCHHENKAANQFCIQCGQALMPVITLMLARDAAPLVEKQNKHGAIVFEPAFTLQLHFEKRLVTLPVQIGQAILFGRTPESVDATASLPSVAQAPDPSPPQPVPDYQLFDLTPYRAAQQGVSRKHALITLVETISAEHVLVIEDMLSTNGTWINGRKLLPFKQRLLRDGDSIALGLLHFTITFVQA